MSGHSKWSTIKHKKALKDSRRGKLFTKLIKDLTIAARLGGSDLSANPRLRTALAAAKGSSMPNDTIDRAIKKATRDAELRAAHARPRSRAQPHDRRSAALARLEHSADGDGTA